MNHFKVFAATISVLVAVSSFTMPTVHAEEIDEEPTSEEVTVEKPAAEAVEEAVEAIEEIVDDANQEEAIVEESTDDEMPEDEEEETIPTSDLRIKIYQTVEILSKDANKYETFLSTEMNLDSKETTTKELLTEAFNQNDDANYMIETILASGSIPEICPNSLEIDIHEDINGTITHVDIKEGNSDED